jgi:C-terminal processing protease CtpA/Prc
VRVSSISRIFRVPSIKSFRAIGVHAVLCLTILNLTACDPAADHTLSASEKEADMKWLFSIFGNNYAPLEYKEKLHEFDFEKLKKTYLSRAMRTKSNDEFYRLMARFVAEFRDAHTGGTIAPSNLPGQAQIAYLGISGVRDGETFRVTDILGSINRAGYQIKIDDRVTKINGMPVFEYIDKVLVPYRDLGNSLANKTLHMNDLFMRVNVNTPIPEEDSVRLTIERSVGEGPKVRDITLPWIKKDLYDFKIDQALFRASQQKTSVLTVADPSSADLLELAILDQRGAPIEISQLIQAFEGKVPFHESFRLISPSTISLKSIGAAGEQPLTGSAKLAKERSIPANAITMEEAKFYPSYMYSIDVKDAKGTVHGKRQVGYVRIEAFDASSADEAIKELRTTLKKFKANGVTSLIVDTIDNPGGSLELAARVSQAFSDRPVRLSDMQFGLNDNWLREMQEMSLSGSDEQRELARRIYQKLREEKNAGKRLSSPFNMSEIVRADDPHYGVRFDKIVILVNEMNASCGDIFPAIMQDNGLAVVAGTKTMGAGGNVESHRFDQAPNSHFKVRQTESLVLRKDGTYIENRGVFPDVVFDVNAGLRLKHDDARQQAEKIILDKDATPAKLAEKRKQAEAAELAAEKIARETRDERAARRAGGLTGDAKPAPERLAERIAHDVKKAK